MNPTPTAEILACPFCGAAPGDEGPVLQVSEKGWHYVWCAGCGASGPENAFFQTDAIPMWNRRASPSAPTTRQILIERRVGETAQEYQVRLSIGVQSFDICQPRETQREAEWLAEQLGKAMDTLCAPQAQPPALSDERIEQIAVEHAIAIGRSSTAIRFARALLAEAQKPTPDTPGVRVGATMDLHNRIVQRLEWLIHDQPISVQEFAADVRELLTIAGVAMDGGMKAAMVKLSRALGHPNPVDAGADQCVEAALIEMAAERIAGVKTPDELMESGPTGTDGSKKPNDAAAIPCAKAGWKLVPVEPTQDMLYAMAECDGYQRGDRDHPMLTRWEDYWRMAINAAPQEPSDRVLMALKAIFAHWNEFGPMHGFDELMDRTEASLRQRLNEKPAPGVKGLGDGN